MDTKNKEKSIRLSVIMLGFNVVFMFINKNTFLQLSNYYFFTILTITLALIEILFLEKKIFITFAVKIGTLLLLLCLVSLVFSGSHINYAVLASYTIIFFLFIICNCQINYTEKEINYLIKSYILSGMIYSLLIIFFNKKYWETGAVRITVAYNNGIKIDPNFLGTFIVFSAIFAMYIFLKNQKKRYFIMSIIIGYATLKTASRMCMIVLVCGYGFVFFEYLINLSTIKKGKIFKIFVIFFVFVFTYLIILQLLPEEITKRLFNISILDNSNTLRLNFWKVSLMVIRKSPFFGYGFQNFEYIIPKIIGIFIPTPHNSYLYIWMVLGIGGVICMVIIYIYIVYKYFLLKKYALAGIAILLFISTFVIEASMSFVLWYNLILLYIICEYQKKVNNYSE
ncbi:O-antigen ligase family protein [Eubacterium maltosivorans]|uniref:O-antigen ligase family protein n=1 Tax=Eubacterium maltosivorans TaxID=2041044 RepID=UPI000942A5E9|nr:O-antigen ligase family protein [Eubacterium maltosivorans]